MNKEKIKIGILGCGRVCEHYLKKILISEKVGTLPKSLLVAMWTRRKAHMLKYIFL